MGMEPTNLLILLAIILTLFILTLMAISFKNTLCKPYQGNLMVGGHGIFPLGSRFTGGYPVCVDNDNNIYIAISMQYKGNESDPYGIIIDADTANTAITYNLYLPGNYCGLSLHWIIIPKDWHQPSLQTR